MIKEIFAGLTLLILLAASLINVHFLGNQIDELSGLISEAVETATSGDWQKATEKAVRASDNWQALDSYTHIFIRHSEIDGTTNAFFDLLGALYSKDPALTESYSLALLARLEGIKDMEKASIGTIF